jgi:hypothetical protein
MIVITREVKKKKALASININNKPSPFDTPSTCFMAKVSKVQLMRVIMIVIVEVRMKRFPPIRNLLSYNNSPTLS